MLTSTPTLATSAKSLAYWLVPIPGGGGRMKSLTLLTPNGQYRYSATDHSGLTRDFISVNVVSGGKLVPTPWAKEQLVRTVASQ